MALQLEIVSKHRELVGDDAVREFHEEGGTIGRSLQNDWILPDPDRYISGRHATIDHKGGIYYLLDTSSNGVYFNDEVEPVGKGNPRRLFNGDRIRMGDFEFTVSLDSGESLVVPLDSEPADAPDHSRQVVEEVSLRTGVKLLDEEELTGDDEFQSVLFGGPSPTPETPPPVETPPRVKKKRRNRPAANDPKPERREVSPVSNTADSLFDAFLEGLGITRTELHPSINRPAMMLTAGHVLREFVEGAVNLLAARASLKSAFRLDQTTVMPRYNNPLKFSESPAELIKQLLVGDEGDYLGAKDAVREACHDLLNHQNAFLDAMNSAFIEFADRFEPDELEEGFDRTIGGSKVFSFMNKSKYWDLYRDFYPILTEKGSGRFPQMFGEEFVRAYERQVAEYQRRDREKLNERSAGSTDQEPDLVATQKLVRKQIWADESEADEKVDDTAAANADQLDQSFIDELDNSMAEDMSQDKLEA